MTDTKRLSLCLLLIISSVYYSSGDIVELPQNDVALEGSTVTLTCTAASLPTYRIMWTEFVTSEQGLVLSDGKQINPTHPNAARYSIVGTPEDYHLQITNVSMADGGRYFCEDVMAAAQSRGGTAELIIINGDPVCTDISTVTGVIVEDRFYWNECDVKYRGNFVPTMDWTGPGDYNTDVSINEFESWSRISFVAVREIDGGHFECTTHFIVPGGLPPEAASNTPSYKYVFIGSTLIVNWGPKDLEINPRLPQYEVGDVLTCTADAMPEPTYIWTNMRTLESQSPGQTFTVTEELLGTEQPMRCNVNSVLEGTLYTADIFINVTVPAITTPTTPGTTTPTTPPPADGPCRDLTGQWTATNPNALVCIEVDTRGNILALIRNGTDPFFVTGNGKTVYNDYKHVGFTGLWPAGSDFGVGAFSGECHSCFGNEILQASGLARNKDHSSECGTSAGTRLTNLYSFTRFGPPCRGPGIQGKVYRPSAEHIKRFGILPENIFT